MPTADLRARVCLPVHPEESRVGPWDLDVLPGRTVEYAVVEDGSQPALGYSFTLEATATDLAGNPLESATLTAKTRLGGRSRSGSGRQAPSESSVSSPAETAITVSKRR